MLKPRHSLLLLAAMALTLSPAALHAADQEAERLNDAGAVLKELLSGPDKEIPAQLERDCRCIAVFPGVIKGAFGWGGRRGHGVLSCRDSKGSWSPPSFLTITGGSFGLQIGVQKTDLVLVVMNEKGARSLLESEFTLGAKGSVAAGPVGRSVEGSTDIKLDAEVYSYARSKGLFAGLSLEGARVNADRKAIARFYGAPLDPKAIVLEHRVPKIPPAAKEYISQLP